MESLYIRLAAPLQSWAGARSTNGYVRTRAYPTVSGLKGLIAASQGWKRGAWESWLDDTAFTIRIDNPGRRSKDFHTITNHEDEKFFKKRILTATRTKGSILDPGSEGSSALVAREYLAGAVFIVEISHPTKLAEIERGLRENGFSIYLGRKAFAPNFPFILGRGEAGMLSSLPSMSKDTQCSLELVESTGITTVHVPGIRRRDEWYTALRETLTL